MAETTGWLVYIIVVAARFLVPLAIPRYPLPGVIACLLIDGVDQSIFQQFPTISLANYQGYDKALDIYYLTIAYASTFRNWTSFYAFQVGRFLFYWRLLGVLLFELIHQRSLLLICPNCFEYFFIFFEFYRLSWNPQRMTKRAVIMPAVFIWLFIKLPQEYWLHVLKLDLTDTLKFLFGFRADARWSVIFASSPVVCLGSIAVMIIVAVGIAWLLSRRLPPADHRLPLSADAPEARFSTKQVRRAIAVEAREITDAALIEKIVLVGMICVIFAQILPEVVATNLGAAIGVAFVVSINTAVSHWMARRGFGWAFSLKQGMVLLLVNAVLFVVYGFLMSAVVQPVRFGNALFFVLLLTLLITLYDRYRQVYLVRFTDN